MKTFRLSACYHPTLVRLVDDNVMQLRHLILHLAGQWNLACQPYTDPKLALEFLTKEYKANPFIERCLQHHDDGSAERLLVDFDIKAIRGELNNADRYNEMAVLVVDYAMPGINGIELCRLIKQHHPFLKIIMLTGEAGKDLAVQIFNEGIIDKFMIKGTPDLLRILAESIHELQRAYFLQLTAIALNKLVNSPGANLQCLEDLAFADFFTKLCLTHQIVEYYLLDNQGSFLLMDAQGKVSWLAMASEEQMLTYSHLAEDDGAPAAIVDGLKNRQMLPFFLSAQDFDTRPANWQPYLHPARPLLTKSPYYYSYISQSTIYAKPEHIKPYAQFLTKERMNYFPANLENEDEV